MTFPARHLASPATYKAAASVLDSAGAPRASLARRRRDLALEGYLELRERVRSGDASALQDFHQQATGLVSGRADHWRATVQAGPLAQARRTLDRIDALAQGNCDHLADAQVAKISKFSIPRYGMCGLLDPYDQVRRGETTAENTDQTHIL